MYRKDVLPVLEKACGADTLRCVLRPLCAPGGLGVDELGIVLGGRGGSSLFLERILERIGALLGEGSGGELGVKCGVLRESVYHR